MAAKPHILFLNEFYHPDICASAVVSTDHLSRMARLRPDWKITVIAGDRAWDDPKRVHPEEETHEGVKILRVGRPPLKKRSMLRRGVGFLSFLRAARKKSRTLGPIDLVIGTTAPPLGAWLACEIAREQRCPYVYKVFDLYPDLTKAVARLSWFWLFNWLWRFRDVHIMRGAAAVVPICEAITDRIRRTRKLSAALVVTIHDGFDDRHLLREHAAPAIEGDCVVQYAGNMGLSHPMETIVQSAEKLARQDIRFQLIGDGPSRKKIEANLPANVRLSNYVPAEQFASVLRSAHICLVSQQEDMWDKALPYKVYSILAAGKPMIFIGSEHSEVVRWLRESGAGLHCNQGKADKLAEQIRHLSENPSVLREMGRRARVLFLERFDSQTAVHRWIELIESIQKSK